MSESVEGICDLCGEPMPEGESMFKFHGYSGPCPRPPLPRPAPIDWQARAEAAEKRAEGLTAALKESVELQSHYAGLLNMYDGGKRLKFADADAWMERLAALAAGSDTHGKGEA